MYTTYVSSRMIVFSYSGENASFHGQEQTPAGHAERKWNETRHEDTLYCGISQWGTETMAMAGLGHSQQDASICGRLH